MEYLPNYAGRSDIDGLVEKELEYAGITVLKMPEVCRKNMGEVKTIVIGELFKWTFSRAWSYWVCDGPGIPIEKAEILNELHGTTVRVGGFAGGHCPRKMFNGLGVGSYHVDTKEGLLALSNTIRGICGANNEGGK